MQAGGNSGTGDVDPAWSLNFSWDEQASLRCGKNEYKPVLSTLENTYGLTKDRNVILVFAPTERGDTEFWTAPELDLVLYTPHLGNGIQHFKFDRTSIVNTVASIR